MKTVIAATTNQGKLREFKQILPDAHVITMAEAGFTEEIVEDGTSFLENAAIKARAVYTFLKSPQGQGQAFDYVIADDSGLEIDYFDKKPGIYSSRWLGADTPYTVKNQIVLDKMKEVPDKKRTARYVCAIVCIRADGQELSVEETAEGVIAREPSGQGGFGYDPIFLFPHLGTFADLTAEQKNAVSHRGKALRAMKALLEEKG